jgi:hypothetical protein
MSEPLPPEIVFTETPDGMHYRLPPRDLRGLPGLKWGLILGACAVLGIAFVVPVVRGPGKLDWTLLLTSLPVVLFVAGPALILFSFLFGHSAVSMQQGKLVAIERGRFFPWARRRRGEQVRQLTVRTGSPGQSIARPAAAPNSASHFCWIEASCSCGKPLIFAWGYPVSLLRPLAEDLNRRLACCLPLQGAANRDVADATFEASPPIPLPPVEVLSSDMPAFCRRYDQPASSKATLERSAQGLTLTVPPRGMVRGSAGLFGFAGCWNSFLTLLTVLSVPALLAGNFAGRDWPFFLMLGLFWAVGIGIGLAAYHMGRRRAVFAVVGESLMVIQAGPLGTKRAEWARDELSDIRPGPCGMTVNKRPILELKIQPKLGKSFGLLAGHDVEELEWIATILRDALHVPAQGDAIETA